MERLYGLHHHHFIELAGGGNLDAKILRSVEVGGDGDRCVCKSLPITPSLRIKKTWGMKLSWYHLYACIITLVTLQTLYHPAKSDIAVIKPLDHFLGMATATFVIALDVLLSRVSPSLDFQVTVRNC